MQTTELEYGARATAGHFALRMYHHYGPQAGAQIMRGVLAGVIAAAASVIGWEETRGIVDQLDAKAHLPPPGTKPNLRIVERLQA